MIRIVVLEEGESNGSDTRSITAHNEADLVLRKKVVYEIVKSRREPPGRIVDPGDLTGHM